MRLAQEQYEYLGQLGYQSFEFSFAYVTNSVINFGTMFSYRDAFWLICMATLVTIISMGNPKLKAASSASENSDMDDCDLQRRRPTNVAS